MTRFVPNILLLIVFTGLFIQCRNDEMNPAEETLHGFKLLVPANASVDQETSLTFRWNSSAKNAVYSVQISINSDLSEPLYEVDNIQDTVLNFSGPLFPLTNFYWSVTALNPVEGKQMKSESGTFSFVTKYIKPNPSPKVSKYYVGANGKDNGAAGTKEEPFKTIAYAARFVPDNEGDTLFIFAGEYLENSPVILPPGVNLIGQNKESVIINSNGFEVPGISNNEQYKKISRSALIQLVSSNGKVENGNQEVSNFTLDGKNKSLKAGIWIESRSNISLHDVHVKYTELRGAVIATANKLWYQEPDVYLTGIKVYNCMFTNCGKDLLSETLGNLNLGQLDGAEIHDIVINDNEGYGIKFMWDGYFKNCSFHNIKTVLSETDNLWGEDISIELWNLGPGNKLQNIESNTWLSLVNHANIFGNKYSDLNLSLSNVKIIDKDGVSSKEGIEIGLPHADISNCYIENKGMGIAIWNMGRENITIRDNIFSNSKYQQNWAGGSAIYIDNSQNWTFNDFHIYNNVFDSHVFAIQIKGSNLGDFDIKNNLFINSKNNELAATGGTISFGHNFLHAINNET